MHDTNRNFFYIVHEVKMKTVFVLTNESGDLNRMINNVYETLGVFLTYDEAVDAMNKEEYKEFDLVLEEIEIGNSNPETNILHSWERHHGDDALTFEQLF